MEQPIWLQLSNELDTITPLLSNMFEKYGVKNGINISLRNGKVIAAIDVSETQQDLQSEIFSIPETPNSHSPTAIGEK